MDRTLVLPVSMPVPVGHRIEIADAPDGGADGGTVLFSIVDLETGIRFQRAEEPAGAVRRWQGQVSACVIAATGAGARTVLTLAEVSPLAAGARSALREADAAAEAAFAQAQRWGGTDRPIEEEPERFW